MTDIKCPFCQQKLQEDIGYDGDYSCPNCSEPYFGSLELWQELIRTRKALKIAVGALKEIKDGKIPVSLGIYMDINDALEQITATLENQNGDC